VNIVSLDVNYQPNADWLISGHYAGKLVFDDSDKHDDFSNAHLLIGHITRDLTKRVDVGLNLSALLDGNGRSAHFGVGPEIGITLAENVRVGLGNNFQGFTDRDLTEEQYTQHGVYLALRLKWDEQLFQRHKEGDK
jgi:hypothetical protein